MTLLDIIKQPSTVINGTINTIKSNPVNIANIAGALTPGLNIITNPLSSAFFLGTQFSNKINYNKKTNLIKYSLYGFAIANATYETISTAYGLVSTNSSELTNTLMQVAETGIDIATIAQMTYNLKDSTGVEKISKVPTQLFNHISKAYNKTKKIVKSVWKNKIKAATLAATLATVIPITDHYTGFLKYPIGGALHVINSTENTAKKGMLWEMVKTHDDLENMLNGKSTGYKINEGFFSSTDAIALLSERAKKNRNIKRGITLYDKNNKELGHINSGNKYTPIEAFPKKLTDIVLYQEDKNFFEHSGINWKAIARASFVNIKNSIAKRSVQFSQGGSTITQQVASFLYPKGKNKLEQFGYKLLELASTYQLEFEYSKEKILEAYLNTCEFSNGIKGYADAAKYYFDRTPKNLLTSQMVLLAITPNNPARHPYYKSTSPHTKGQLSQMNHRAKMLIGRMVKGSYITKKDGIILKNNLAQGLEKKRSVFNTPYPEVIELTNRLLIKGLKEKGIHEDYHPLLNILKTSLLREHPTKINTTIDINMQKDLTRLTKKNKKLNNQKYAYMIMDATNGQIRAISTNHTWADNAWQLYAKNQFASTIKPFIYGLALEKGIINSYSKLDDNSMISNEFDYSINNTNNSITFKIPGEDDYEVSNWNNKFLRSASWQKHLKTSNNISPINLVMALNSKGLNSLIYSGPKQIQNLFKDAKIEVNDVEKNQYSVAIGTIEASTYDIARMYTALIDGKVMKNNINPTSTIINSIDIGSSTINFETDNTESTRIFSQSTANELKNALKTKNYQAYTKSGTSQFTKNGNIARYMSLIETKNGPLILACYSTANNELSSHVHKHIVNSIIHQYAKRTRNDNN